MDGLDRGSSLYYARELHELADILLHAAVRPVLAAEVWIRFVIVTGYGITLALTVGFAAFWVGFRFWLLAVFRKLWLRAVCIGTVLGAGTVAFWMETPERLNADIAMLLFPRQMVILAALASPARRLSAQRASRWCGRKIGHVNCR